MKILASIGLVAAIMLGTAIAVYSGETKDHVRAIRDFTGREVLVPGAVERMVALGPGALRLVAYLQTVDRIVGIENIEKQMSRSVWSRPYASTLSGDFFKLPIVGPGGAGKLPDFERLVLARPDVIVTINIEPGDVRNIEAKTRIPTVGLSCGELGSWGREMRESLLMLGTILGKKERARHVNAFIQSIEQDLQRRTKDVPYQDRPSAYFGGISLKGAQGFTSTQSGYTPADMINARNVADVIGKCGHIQTDKEHILYWNPDVIFTDISSRAILEQDFAKDRQFYLLLKAAQADRIFSLLPYNNYNTNIEIAIINAYFIGKQLYPDAFADVELQSKAEEIFGKLLSIRPDSPMPACGSVRFPETGPIKWNAASVEK